MAFWFLRIKKFFEIQLNFKKLKKKKYDLENNLVKTFKNQVELAAEFGVNKTTISRKVISGKVFNEKYYIRKLEI